MNIKLLMRILVGIMSLFTLGGILSPDEMMKSFGMKYTPEAAVILPFAITGQIFFIILTIQIINWVSDLSKVAKTFALITAMPVALNVYLALNNPSMFVTAFYIEQAIWSTFVVLFLTTKK